MCDKKYGTIAIGEPETKWWAAYNLGSLEMVIKVLVNQSKCFTLVAQFKALRDNASAANAQQSMTTAKPGRMYPTSSTKGEFVCMLDPGRMLYPTGEKKEVMCEVDDELGNKGWVLLVLFELAK